MKTLKNGWVTILLLSVAFASCQKELSVDSTAGTGGSGGTGNGGGTGGGSNSNYYIKFKKDGVAANYTSNLIVLIQDLGVAGVTSFTIAGSASPNTGSLEGLSIAINFSNNKKPDPGTYTEGDNTLDYIVGGVYNPNSTTMVWGAGQFAPSAKPLKVTIATKTATEITGTFEGAFYKTDLTTANIGPDFITITEGQFKLKLP